MATDSKDPKKKYGDKLRVAKSEFLSMNGGDGTYSYSKNSNHQMIAANTVKGKIDQEIVNNLDVKHLSSLSNTISIADLGCSTGPNTFIAMQNILEAIQLKYHCQCPNSKPLDFQIFFNDRPSNDFNTLFNSIPKDCGYFVAGVPGSFYSQLFPESSLHFVHTCHALHWLSKLPEELLNKDSPAWNKGNIYYLNAPREVYNAYASQFYEDIDDFLSVRAKEIVAGGMMVIIMAGSPNGVPSHSNFSSFGTTFDLMGSSLMEMAKEGLISEELVDSFNIPIYAASPEEMIGLVERNGYFSIERIEFVKSTLEGTVAEASVRMKHSRAGMEGMLSKHFGSETIDEIFERLGKKLIEHSELLASRIKESGQLFLVLKRK
ncbi:SAM dependent carboxyl methyltransferase [Trema orientale]|uniref:SAM dependent carboxyl methyltransferase n=1 Tax=Trema orientale TaxID=63057 RepID=A0A2P5D491_TREOI|nr:SAM dependent carboxyl methyltransferase [Trema orientale]